MTTETSATEPAADDADWAIAPVGLVASDVDVIADTALLYELTGRNQTWVAACSDAVTAGTVAAASLVNDEDGSYLRALHNSSNTTAASLTDELVNFDVSAAHAIRDLANVLAAPADDADVDLAAACAPILDHCDEASLHGVGSRDLAPLAEWVRALCSGSEDRRSRRRHTEPGRAPDAPTEGEGSADRSLYRRLALVIDYLAGTGRPSASFVALLACHLARVLPEPIDRETVRVLLADDPEDGDGLHLRTPGVTGRLTLSRLAAGPPGLHPDPRQMAFFSSENERFIFSAAAAYAASRGARSASGSAAPDQAGCLVWSISIDGEIERPCNQFVGGSMGGAFAVALHELSVRTRLSGLQQWLGRMGLAVQRLRIQPRSAVSAEVVDPSGRLGPVGHLSRKIDAAARAGIGLIVVSAADEEEARRLATPFGIEVRAAGSTAEAVQVARTYSNPGFRRLVRRALALALVLVVLAAGLTTAAVVESRQRAAERLATARSVGADRLRTEVARIRDSDPYTALRLGEAALAVDPGTASQSSLVDTLVHTSFASRITDRGQIQSVAVSPSGRTIADGTLDGQLSLWELDAGSHTTRLAAQHVTGAIRTLLFLPDGRTLVTGGVDNLVLIWDVGDRTRPAVIGTIPDHTQPIQALAFDAARQTLATASSDGTVRLWDLHERSRPRALATLGDHTTGAWSVAFSPDDHLLAVGSGAGALTIWSVADLGHPQRLADLRPHSKFLRGLAFGADHRTLLTGGGDANLKVWDLTDPRHPVLTQTLTDHTGPIFQLAMTADRRTAVTASYDRTAIVWDVPRYGIGAVRATTTLRGHTEYVRAVAVTPDDKRYVTGSLDGSMIVWNARPPGTPTLASTVTAESNRTRSVALSPDHQILVAGDSAGTVQPYDVRDQYDPRPLAPIRGPSGNISRLAFSPDGTVLAGASWDGTVWLWDVTDPADPHRLPVITGHEGPVYWVGFDPSGRLLVTAGQDGTFRLLDVSDRREPRLLSSVAVGGQAVLSAVVNPAGDRLVTSTIDRALRLWDISNPSDPRLVSTVLAHDEAVMASAYRPGTGQLVASSYDSTTSVWRPSSDAFSLVGRIPGHRAALRAQDFTPDGSVLATAGDDGTIMLFALFEPDRPLRLATVDLHTLAALRNARSPRIQDDAVLGLTMDFTTLAAARGDGTTFVLDTSGLQAILADPSNVACAHTVSGLERDEWARYLPGVPYQVTCPG